MNLVLEDCVRTIPDFPQPGVVFRDLAPLYADNILFTKVVEQAAGEIFQEYTRSNEGPARLYPVSSRGYLLGAALSWYLSWPMYPVRRVNKVPGDKVVTCSSSEYGIDHLALATEDVPTEPGFNVIVDDVLATGGTIKAVAGLINSRTEGCTMVYTILDIGLPLVDMCRPRIMRSTFSLRESSNGLV